MIKQLKKVTDHLFKKKCCQEDLASMIDGKNNSQSWEGKGYAVIDTGTLGLNKQIQLLPIGFEPKTIQSVFRMLHVSLS